MKESLYSLEALDIDGRSVALSSFRGKVLLIVNVASRCGFTSQYEGLQKLHEKHTGQGFAVLGFPCNQFGSQEPGDAEEIKSFCSTSFGVTFPMFSKVEVNGDDTHPLFKLLKEQAPGVLGTEAIKWNFTKFLVSREGVVLSRFAPTTAPAALDAEIQAVL